MPTDPVALGGLATLVGVAAVLYSSVGHAGASGYLAAMALYGVAPAAMKPTALVLNVLVATLGTVRFARAGHTPWRLLLPLCAGSVPAAFLGGRMQLPTHVHEPFLAVLLILASFRLWFPSSRVIARPRPSFAGLVLVGAVLGLAAGLTGIGGGVFLSPILILTGWEEPRRTAGASAPFILVNSIAGLAGHLTSVQFVPPAIAVWAVAAISGGLLGAAYGSRKLATRTLQRLLAAVLLTAGLKLILARR